MKNNTINWKKYFFSFVITSIIFGTAMYASNYFNQKKIDELRSIQDKIAIDILSSETQFSLLEQSSCENVNDTSLLSQELGNLEEKLSYTEKNRGDNPEIVTLKRYYTLLQIKDIILMNKISEKCKTKPVSIVYFYSNQGDCLECEKEGYVLTRLRQTYPTLRVYAFDYNLDLSAVKTLISINKIENKLPAIFVKNKAYYGFQSIEDLEKNIPELMKLKKEMANQASSTTESSKGSNDKK